MKVIYYKTSQPWGKLPATIHMRMGSGLASPSCVTGHWLSTRSDCQGTVTVVGSAQRGAKPGFTVVPANSHPLEGIVFLMQR